MTVAILKHFYEYPKPRSDIIKFLVFCDCSNPVTMTVQLPWKMMRWQRIESCLILPVDFAFLFYFLLEDFWILEKNITEESVNFHSASCLGWRRSQEFKQDYHTQYIWQLCWMFLFSMLYEINCTMWGYTYRLRFTTKKAFHTQHTFWIIWLPHVGYCWPLLLSLSKNRYMRNIHWYHILFICTSYEHKGTVPLPSGEAEH